MEWKIEYQSPLLNFIDFKINNEDYLKYSLSYTKSKEIFDKHKDKIKNFKYYDYFYYYNLSPIGDLLTEKIGVFKLRKLYDNEFYMQKVESKWKYDYSTLIEKLNLKDEEQKLIKERLYDQEAFDEAIKQYDMNAINDKEYMYEDIKIFDLFLDSDIIDYKFKLLRLKARMVDNQNDYKFIVLEIQKRVE